MDNQFIKCIFCTSTGKHPVDTDRQHILNFRKLRGPDKKRRQRIRIRRRKEKEEEQRILNSFFDHYNKEKEEEQRILNSFFDHYNKKHGFSHKSSCGCYECSFGY